MNDTNTIVSINNLLIYVPLFIITICGIGLCIKLKNK